MIDLKINGTSQTNYILSTPFKDTIDEELDQFNFQIKSTTRLSFNKYDKVEYKITQPLGNSTQTILEKVFALFGCNESWEGEYWLYQITCISPTKILENIIINGMAETYPVYNLYQQMERVRQKINAQQSYEMSVYPEIVFDGTTIGQYSYVSNFGISDFLWSVQVNAREIFNDMLDKADSLVIGKDFTASNGNITQITLKAVKRELKGTQLINSANDIENGGLNDVKELVKGITINRNSEYACGNIISLIKNGIAKDNVQQAYTPARNTDLTIDDSADWHIITQEPIYSLNKVYALIPVLTRLYYWKYENGDWVEHYYARDYYPNYDVLLLPADITEYIVEKDVFDAMSVKEQKMHCYFKRGEKGIYGLFKLYKNSPIWSTTAMYNIATKLFVDDLNNVGDITYYTNANGVVVWNNYENPSLLKLFNWETPAPLNLTTNGVSIHISTSGDKEDGAISRFQVQQSPSSSEMKYSLFSINYQPYCDSVVKIEKTNIANIEANTKNLCVIKNQSDRTIDAEKYFNSQQSLINRLGNKEMIIDAMVDLTADYSFQTTLWNLGDYMTLSGVKWTIIQREFENYNENTLKVRYMFSKDYNGSNVDIQIKRDKRLYGIPLTQYVDRYILLRGSDLDTMMKKIAIQCWDDFSLNQTESTNNSELGYCIFEAVKIGNANIVNKVVRCKDNYAVDIERTKYSQTIVNINLRYCDTDGYKENIQMYKMSDVGYNNYVAPNISDYSRLPFIPATEFQNVINQGYAGSYLLNGIKKDKMERLIFVFREA